MINSVMLFVIEYVHNSPKMCLMKWNIQLKLIFVMWADFVMSTFRILKILNLRVLWILMLRIHMYIFFLRSDYCYYHINIVAILLKEMEIGKPLESNTPSKHHPLTICRLIRGVICLVVFISTAFMFLVYFAPFAVILRFFSIHCSRKATSFVFAIWLALWPFLFEKINMTKVVFYGDTVPSKERVMLIANHRTEVDWMYLWDLALRKGCLGHIKYILKNTLMKLPLFGWGFHLLEFIPLERKWEVDEPVLRRMVSTFADARDPLWLAIFPEGTDYTYVLMFFSQILLKYSFICIFSYFIKRYTSWRPPYC